MKNDCLQKSHMMPGIKTNPVREGLNLVRQSATTSYNENLFSGFRFSFQKLGANKQSGEGQNKRIKIKRRSFKG